MSDIQSKETKDLCRLFAAMDNADEVFALLQDLFTVREIKEISSRLQVARLLARGESYSSIEAQTGASATTIARVSKALNYGEGGYSKALEILGT